MKAVPYHTGEKRYANSETGEIEVVGDDKTTRYTSKEVCGDVGAFLKTYSFILIFTLCCSMVLFGISLIILALKKAKPQKANR